MIAHATQTGDLIRVPRVILRATETLVAHLIVACLDPYGVATAGQVRRVTVSRICTMSRASNRAIGP
jgi:hypothetical protein